MAAETDKTIIRPRPGRGSAHTAAAAIEDRTLVRPRAGPQHASASPGDADATLFRPQTRTRARGPLRLGSMGGFERDDLVEQAADLLHLALQLRQLHEGVELVALHAQVLERLRAFRPQAEANGHSAAVAERASYLLCAFLDEMVLNTPWGEHSDWSRRSLLRLCHGETWGGERVFLAIKQALDTPRREQPYLHLAWLCLSLGFQGKYRVAANGQAALDALRGEIAPHLHGPREQAREALTPPLEPVVRPAVRLQSYVAVWLLATGLLLAALGLYGYLQFELNRESDRLLGELAGLVPPSPADAAPAAAAHPALARLRRLMAPEIARGVLEVEAIPGGLTVVLRARELFGSGSAELAPAYYPVLDKLGHVLAGISGPVVVAGHTDDQAMRSSRFPSNWHLSLGRAAAVANYLGREARLSGRLLPEGRADTQPVADNASAAGRARNRRVTLELTR